MTSMPTSSKEFDASNSPNLNVKPKTWQVNDNNEIELGGVSVPDLINKYGTPLYVLDEDTITSMARAYKETFEEYYPAEALPLFASKANLNLALCKLAERCGLGLDVVSGGELYTAIRAGFPMEKILFNGNNKTIEELELALHHKVGLISVDNFYELELLDEIAKKKGVTVDILLRITPGIECHTHDYIKTGQIDTKFGFENTRLSKAIELVANDYKDSLNLKGLHAHIGSQIFEVAPFEDLVQVMLNMFYNIRENYGIEMTELNLGGGYGIKYTQDDDPPNVRFALARVIERVKKYANKIEYPLPRILVEPGRSLVATAGVTLYTVGSTKHIPHVRKYVAVDGGMGDNIRPALYQAVYSAEVANKLNQPAEETVRIVGKYCESGDVLIDSLTTPKIESGDTLIVYGTGAYNASMASNYNRIPRPATVMVENGHSHVIVQRESLDNIIQQDLIPDHLLGDATDSKTEACRL